MAFTVSYIYDVIDRYSGPLRKIQRQTNRFTSATQRASIASKKLSQKLLNAQSVIGTFAGVMGGTALLSNFTNFETAMNVARGTTKATEQDFLLLSKRAKELGATTQFSATEAARGIDMLGRNGLTATQILNGAADASLLLSAATGTDLANSANIATDVMANFGRSAKDLAWIVDRIAGVTINSKFNIDDYRLALAQAGGVAGSVGVTIDDFNSSVAAISPLFSSGSDAGTSFKTFLISLNPKTKEAAKMMRSLGLLTASGASAFYDAAGKMRSMADISGALNKAFSGLSEQQRNQAAETIFGTDAMRAALGLARVSREEFLKLSDQIGNVKAQELAADRMRGLSGVIKTLKSVLEALNIAVFESGLATFLTKSGDKLVKFIRRLTESSPKLLFFVSMLGLVLTVAGPMVVGLGMLAASISAITGLAATLGISFVAVSAPMLLVGALIAYLSSGFGIALFKSAALRQSFANLADAIAPLFVALKTIAVFIGTKLGIEFSKSTDELKIWGDLFANIINYVAATIKTFFNLIGGLSKATAALTMGEGIGGAWTALKETIGYGAATDKAKATAATNNRVEMGGEIRVSAAKGSKVESANIGLNTGSNLAMAY